MIDYDKITPLILDISPTASRTLNNEEYRIALENENVSEATVFNLLLSRMIDDLTELGLEFIVDISDIFPDWYIGEQVLEVIKYLSPNTLYKELLHNKQLNAILSSAIEDDEYDDSLVTRYLHGLTEYLGNIDRAVIHLLDKVTSNEIYESYMTSVLKMVEIHNTPNVTTENLNDYAKLLSRRSRIFNYVLDELEERAIISTEEQDRLKKRMSFDIKRLTGAETINQYSWTYTRKLETLSSTELEAYETYMREITAASKLHMDFYSYTQTNLNFLDFIGILARSFADDYEGKTVITAAMEEIEELFALSTNVSVINKIREAYNVIMKMEI